MNTLAAFNCAKATLAFVLVPRVVPPLASHVNAHARWTASGTTENNRSKQQQQTQKSRLPMTFESVRVSFTFTLCRVIAMLVVWPCVFVCFLFCFGNLCSFWANRHIIKLSDFFCTGRPKSGQFGLHVKCCCYGEHR